LLLNFVGAGGHHRRKIRERSMGLGWVNNEGSDPLLLNFVGAARVLGAGL